MKRILTRIGYDISKNTIFFITKIIVYVVIFSLLFFSIYINSLAKHLETSILSNFNIYAGTISKLNTYLYDFSDIDSYFDDVEDYQRFSYNLADFSSVDYFDFNFSNHFMNPIKPISIDEEDKQLTIYSRTKESEEAIQNFFSQGGMVAIGEHLKSVDQSDFLDMHFNAVSILDGRTFTQEEIEQGKHVCIVHHSIMKSGENTEGDVTIGKILPISEYVNVDGEILYQKQYDCEIVGIYTTEDGKGVHSAAGLWEIPIYVPYNFYKEMMTSSIESNRQFNPKFYDASLQAKTFMVHPAVYGFKTLDDLRSFLNELDTYQAYFPDVYQYFSSIDSYYLAISNIVTISDSFYLISNICFLISLLISAILVTFEIHFRHKEIGILKSFGERNRNLLIQFLLEMAIVTVVAIGIANPLVKAGVGQFGERFFVDALKSTESFQGNLSESYHVQNFEVMNGEKEGSGWQIAQRIATYEIILLLFTGVELIVLIKRINPKDLCSHE